MRQHLSLSGASLKLRAPTAFDFVLLLLLGALLGSSFVLMKASVASLSVFMTVFFRLVIALVVLLVAAKFQQMKLPPLVDVGFWLVCGVLGFSANILPFGLITWAEVYIETNLASLYMATIPLFSLVLAHATTSDEKMTANRIFGMFVGFLGVFVLLYEPHESLAEGIMPQLACILAALLYAASRVLTKRVAMYDPLIVSLAVTIFATLAMAPFALPFLPSAIDGATGKSLLAVLLLGIFPTACAFVILYRLIRTVGAVFQTSVNYLVPCFGFLWGYLVYSETPSRSMWFAIALIFFGLYRATKSDRNSNT